MAWWVRREQWPHMKLGPFADRASAEYVRDQCPDACTKVGGAEWTWSVVSGGWDYGHSPD